MTKQLMPDGWVHVDWKDQLNNRWSDNVPDALFPEFKMRIFEIDGRIIKIVR